MPRVTPTCFDGRLTQAQRLQRPTPEGIIARDIPMVPRRDRAPGIEAAPPTQPSTQPPRLPPFAPPFMRVVVNLLRRRREGQ